MIKKIMVKEWGKELEVREQELGLKDMQELVGGYIDRVGLPEGIDMWVNDEGILDELPLNVVLEHTGYGQQPIHGNIFFAAHDSDGESTSLSDQQIEWLNKNTQQDYGITMHKTGDGKGVHMYEVARIRL